MVGDGLNVFQKLGRMQLLAEMQEMLLICHDSIQRRKGQIENHSISQGWKLYVLDPMQFHEVFFKLLGCMIETDLQMQHVQDN